MSVAKPGRKRFFSEAFQQKYSLLNNIRGVIDGLKLYLEPGKYHLIQNAYYNG